MFVITQRQYDLIMHQAQACYPQEAGGILGGRENIILGVLPVYNKYLYDRTGTFGMTNEDLDRGYRFLAKHNLEYHGIYHTHPHGTPYPSKEDLSHGQKYIFIIGLADRYNPQLYAWQIQNNQPYPIPVQIVDESLVQQMFLSPENPNLVSAAPTNEMVRLASMIDDMLHRRIKYKKEKPRWKASSFSTMA